MREGQAMSAPAIRINLLPASRPRLRLVQISNGSGVDSQAVSESGQTLVAKDSGKSAESKQEHKAPERLRIATVAQCRLELLPAIAKEGFNSKASALRALDSWVEGVRQYFESKQRDEGLPTSALNMIVRDLMRHKTGESLQASKRPRRMSPLGQSSDSDARYSWRVRFPSWWTIEER